MKYKCCEYLLHELVFAQTSVIPCCCSPTNKYDIKFFDYDKSKNFDMSYYISEKSKYINMFKQNIIPETCRGCNQIEEKEWDENNSINRIIITNRTKCSCNCIYCSLITTSTQTKEELNTRDVYDIKPLLLNLRNQNVVKQNCLITIAGGECSEYPKGELEFIIYFASILNCKLEILSAGIIYSKAIESALKVCDCILKISVDSGTKKTYEKIKQVKAYDRVWNNIKEYIESSKDNPNRKIIVKYILLPEINDNIRETKKFVSKCKSIGCTDIELTVEYNWFGKHKDIPPAKNIKEAILCLKSSGLNIHYELHSKEYLQNI